MSNSFFKNLVEQIKDEDTSIVADGQGSAEYSGCIDTGSYILNAVLSGSLFGGVPNNKITAFAGESATGKTFFVLGIVKAFLDANPDAGVMYYDTEAAVTKSMMEQRGIDTKRVIVAEMDTIQKFRTHAIKTLEYYEKSGESRPPFMMVLDSLGLLSTTKEMEDITEGKETRDMTKAQVIKAAFRVLTLKLAKVKVPLLVTNHVYAAVGAYVPTNEISGGCLIAGTNVFTRRGFIGIENITTNDLVMTKEGEFKNVLECHAFDDKQLLQIDLEDGTSVTCTPEHKFFMGNQWIEAKNIIIGDDLQTLQK
jgi:RecA/RadA recombinase